MESPPAMITSRFRIGVIPGRVGRSYTRLRRRGTNCCPAPVPPDDPCTICPGGATSGDDFVPFTTPFACGEVMASAKLFEAASEDCKFYVAFEILCSPGAIDATVTAAPTTICEGFVRIVSPSWFPSRSPPFSWRGPAHQRTPRQVQRVSMRHRRA